MKQSLRAAINAKCADCIGDPCAPASLAVQIELCSTRDCPLWVVRPARKARRISTENLLSDTVRKFYGLPEGLGAGRFEIRREPHHGDVTWPTTGALRHALYENGGRQPCQAAPGAASRPAAANHDVHGVLHCRLPDVGPRARYGALCREYHGDSPQNSDFVRVRAPLGPGPRRLRPRSDRFPADRRVRPPTAAPRRHSSWTTSPSTSRSGSSRSTSTR